MNKYLKKIAKPFVRSGLQIVETFVGIRTDPTGYEPERWKMLINKYEEFLIKNILEKIPINGVFVDVGANVGYISRRIAEAYPDSVKIIAIEPNPRLTPILKFNLRNFAQCKTMDCGLGSKEEVLQFYQGKESALGSFVKGYNEAFMSHVSYQVSTTNIPVYPGDSIFNDIPLIDVLKVDVEGFELEVFKGLKKTLDQGRINNIYFEFQNLSQQMAGFESNTLLNYLNDSGYNIFGLEGEWFNRLVKNDNLHHLIKSLGDKGYTTLLAKKP